MKFALHAGSFRHTNVAIDIRTAQVSGFDGIELFLPRVKRYLDAGFTSADLAQTLGGLQVPMIDFLLPIESTDPSTQERIASECGRMARLAQAIGCPAIQVVALSDFSSPTWADQREILISRLRELTDIANPYGVRLAIECAVFSPFRQLSQALEVIEAVGPDKVGLCLDTWHIWLSGTPWEQVAQLDPDLILSVQLADAAPRSGPEWRDEDRTVLPGKGVVPLGEAIDAVLATGYRGYWSYEAFSRHHCEWHPEDFASAMLDGMRDLTANRVTR